MIINPDEFDGWEKDHWKNTTPGNWREFIAVNGDVMLWLTNPSGDDSWKLNIGTGTRLNKSKQLSRTSFESRNEALLAAADFMESYPTVSFRKNSFPNLVDGDGESINLCRLSPPPQGVSEGGDTAVQTQDERVIN